MRLQLRKPEKRLARQRRAVGPNGWTCHVCGDYRPDAKISVHSSQQRLAGGVEVTTNARYCNDRQKCREGVATLDFPILRNMER